MIIRRHPAATVVPALFLPTLTETPYLFPDNRSVLQGVLAFLTECREHHRSKHPRHPRPKPSFRPRLSRVIKSVPSQRKPNRSRNDCVYIRTAY